VDLRFREVAKDSPEFLDRAQFRFMDETARLLDDQLQSWPTFVGAEKLAELKRAGVEISRLLRSVPDRVFQSDPERLSDFYGLGSPLIAELLFTPPTGAETMLSRGDFIETAGGFKCIEFNFTPSLGGWGTTIITGLQLSAPPTARFIESEGLRPTFTDTMLEMLRHVIEGTRSKGIVRTGDLTIAFMTHPEAVATVVEQLDYFNREMQRTIETMGLDLRGRVVSCSPERLIVAGNRVFHDNQRVAAVVELGLIRTPPHVYRPFKGGLVGLYNGPMGAMLSDKRNLALLSQHAASARYSPEEQALIEAHVPWTRLVAPGEVDYGGEMRPLVELLTADQGRFVLKQANAFGGKGVVLGRFASPELWRHTLDKAVASRAWVAQEIAESLPYLYQSGDYGCSVHDMVWGPFVFGERYGGVVLRMQPAAAGGPVNLNLSASEGIVLEV
jgi:hypothetical protein